MFGGITPRIAIIGLVCFVAGIAVTIGWMSGDRTYEECMLREMHGQNISMLSTVRTLCDKRFKKEVYVPIGGIKYEWDGGAFGVQTIVITDSGEYNLTRLKASFSLKECSASVPSDFNLKGEAKIENKVSRVSIDAPLDGSIKPLCMRMEEFYGTYR
jgi:hypothetical protein